MANEAFLAGVDAASGKRRKDSDSDQGGAPSAFVAGTQAMQRASDTRKAKSTLKKAQQPSGLDTTQPALTELVDSYKRGGVVRKTGVAYVHKGEHIIPARRSGSKPARKRIR